MSFEFNVSNNAIDSHQTSPYWLALIIPYTERRTYDRHSINPTLNRSFPSIDNAPTLTDRYLLVTDDCIAWECSSSTSSHTSSLGMTLKQTNIRYASAVMPGDWVMFWAFNSKDKYDRVVGLIKKGQRINEFDNAPKFVGKVSSNFRNKNVNPATGAKTLVYTVSCHGYSELDSKIYYNQDIGFRYQSLFSTWADMGRKVNELIASGLTKTDTGLPQLLKILLGVGLGENFKGTSEVVTSPNEVYYIPTLVAKLLLGVDESPQKKQFSYTDILNTYVGVETYQDSTVSHPNPYTVDSKFANVFRTRPVYGEFVPQPLQFNNQPVWAILDTYLGAPINQMFTCLRTAPPDKDGKRYVLPSLVIRQLPFTTGVQDLSEIFTTDFKTLPRWVIDDNLILNYQYGRSNALRCNYVQLTGAQPFNPEFAATLNYTHSPPVYDSADIKRSGLETFMKQVGVFFNINGNKSKDNYSYWNRFMADILFESQLKLTGTVVLKGVEEPIVEGDNCVVEGTLYHIERVVHTGSIQPNGFKTFNTTLNLTNGLDLLTTAEDLEAGLVNYPEIGNQPIDPSKDIAINFE